jgi:hypothetical protein
MRITQLAPMGKLFLANFGERHCKRQRLQLRLLRSERGPAEYPDPKFYLQKGG